jgi:hypothetical protein
MGRPFFLLQSGIFARGLDLIFPHLHFFVLQKHFLLMHFFNAAMARARDIRLTFIAVDLRMGIFSYTIGIKKILIRGKLQVLVLYVPDQPANDVVRMCPPFLGGTTFPRSHGSTTAKMNFMLPPLSCKRHDCDFAAGQFSPSGDRRFGTGQSSLPF